MTNNFAGIEFLLITGFGSVLPNTNGFTFFKKILFIFMPVLSIIYMTSSFFSGGASELKVQLFEAKEHVVNLSLNFNEIGVFLCTVVCIILVCVVTAALCNDKKVINYCGIYGLLNIFAFFMCFCILSANMFSFFIGMEVIGYVSALLVGFSDKRASIHFSTVLLFNLLSSILFLIALCMIFNQFGTTEFYLIRDKMAGMDTSCLRIPVALLLISCICKSAQFPFSYWLVLASKANMFVSIFIHTATVLGVGVLLLCKMSFLFEAFPFAKTVMIIIGSLTGIVMGMCSIAHTDVKKIMACSSCAYTGLMFVNCGIGSYSGAILYFVGHAFFKSLIFLSFAYVVYAMFLEKNIKKMGGLNTFVPNISDIVLIAVSSAIGIPFFVSFFSKHEFILLLYNNGNFVILSICILISILLLISIIRLTTMSIYGESRIDENISSRITDVSFTRLLPFWVLLSASMFLSFVSWSLFRHGKLSFYVQAQEMPSPEVDIFSSAVIELIQIGIAAIIFVKLKKIGEGRSFMISMRHGLRSHRLSLAFFTASYSFFLKLFSIFSQIDNKVRLFFTELINRKIVFISEYIDHKNMFVLYNHILYYSLIIVLLIVCLIFKGSIKCF